MPIMTSQPASYNCPNCGAELPLRFRHAKMAVCEHCDATIFLEDDGMRLAGTRSVLAEMPSLIRLGQAFRSQGQVAVEAVRPLSPPS